MDIALLGAALGVAGAYVRYHDTKVEPRSRVKWRRNRVPPATVLAEEEEGEEDDFDTIFSQTGPSVKETIYSNSRYDHNTREFTKVANHQYDLLQRDKLLFEPEERAQRYVFENDAYRQKFERFSDDIPSGRQPSMFVSNKKAQPNFAANMMPEVQPDHAAVLTQLQNYSDSMKSIRKDGTMLHALAAPDMPLSDVVTQIMPKAPEELFVNVKADARPVKREPLPDVRFEMPAVIAELPPSRNPLAGRKETHQGFYGNEAMVQNQPNRETVYVSKDLDNSQKRKKYDDMPFSWQPAYDLPDHGQLARKEIDGVRDVTGRPTYDPSNYTQLGLKETGKNEVVDALPPTRKEHFLHIASRAQGDMDQIIQNMHRPENFKTTGRELLMHEPRLGPPDTSLLRGAQAPLLSDMDVPRTARRELNIFSMDPDSGLVSKESNLWSKNDGRGTVVLPPKAGLRETLMHEPRLGPRNRPDIDVAQPRPQVHKSAKRNPNSEYNIREPIRRTADSEIFGYDVGEHRNIKQIVDWDSLNRTRFQGMEVGTLGPDKDEFNIHNSQFKSRKQSVLESGKSWPGDHRV